MAFSIRYSEEKNQILKATRGVGYEDAIESIKAGLLLADIAHPSKKYTHQRIYIINIRGYSYAVPYVMDYKKQEIFLKTMYASRVFTHKFLRRKAK